MQPTPWADRRIVGASLLLVAWLGSQAIAATVDHHFRDIGCACLAPLPCIPNPAKASPEWRLRSFLITGRSFTVLLARRVPELPARLVEYGPLRSMAAPRTKPFMW